MQARKLGQVAALALMVKLQVLALSAGTINVFLVGGQSNADGRDFKPDTVVPEELKKQENVPFYYNRKLDLSNTTSTSGTLIPLQPTIEAENTIHFGPELSFGKAMADYYQQKNESVAILKYSYGGTNLIDHWKAGGTAGTEGDGGMYKGFQTIVGRGLTTLKEAHPGDTIVIKGMIWMQGEADADKENSANQYEENLKRFIVDIRLTYGKDLPFVIGQVSQTALKQLETLRTAQANVARDVPLTGMVDTKGLTMKDALHFDGAGQIILGRKYAEEMQRLLK
ncbi:MAG: sialate O-acetylesterase [Verrucomicrobiales bacterium]|jgi:hypothetical protein|nr:sialate O-acetylesterase [Verrucomicrobiales bacterium]